MENITTENLKKLKLKMTKSLKLTESIKELSSVLEDDAAVIKYAGKECVYRGWNIFEDHTGSTHASIVLIPINSREPWRTVKEKGNLILISIDNIDDLTITSEYMHDRAC